jgi:hypothetical protein
VTLFAEFTKDFFVAPDPRDLWKDLPVTDDEGYPAVNEDSGFLEIPGGGHVAVAASRRGRMHANSGKPRDDFFFMRTDPLSGWTAVAVADGAGSSRFSRKGAALACETAVDAFLGFTTQWCEEGKGDRETFKTFVANLKSVAGDRISLSATDSLFAEADEGENAIALACFPLEAANRSYRAVAGEAKRRRDSGLDRDRQAELRDYQTTLVFAAFKKLGDTGFFMMSFWLGNGGIALCSPNGTGEVKVLGRPSEGELASRRRYLTMREELDPAKALERVWLSFPDDFDALVLASDGITAPFFQTADRILSPAEWDKFWNVTLKHGAADTPGCPELFDGSPPDVKRGKLLDWLNFWALGEHDDRTLLVVKKSPDDRVVNGKPFSLTEPHPEPPALDMPSGGPDHQPLELAAPAGVASSSRQAGGTAPGDTSSGDSGWDKALLPGDGPPAGPEPPSPSQQHDKADPRRNHPLSEDQPTSPAKKQATVVPRRNHQLSEDATPPPGDGGNSRPGPGGRGGNEPGA